MSVGIAAGLEEEALLWAWVSIDTEVTDTVLDIISSTLGGVSSRTNDKFQSGVSVIEGDFKILPSVSGWDDIGEDLLVTRLDVEGLLVPVSDEVKSESEGD